MAMVNPICRDELLLDICSATVFTKLGLVTASEIWAIVSLIPESVLVVGMRSVCIMTVCF